MIELPEKDRYGWDDLVEVVRALRGPGGCPWDRAQTHASIRRDLLEETWEVADALDRDDPAAIREELGDLLLQAVFHAQIESERGRSDIGDVVDGVVRKLIYRHPHVFGDAEARDGQAALDDWEARKRREKGQSSTADAIEAVPHTLPALWRAEKIQKKAGRAGFDWTFADGALSKLEEEVREVRDALDAGLPPDAPHSIREEVGDVLFMASEIAQRSGVDPEDALHRACDKFQRRFRLVESMADRPLSECGQDELRSLWGAAKAALPDDCGEDAPDGTADEIGRTDP